MKVCLLSPYEVDYQPLGIIGPLAYLKNMSHNLEVCAYDLSKEKFDYNLATSFDIVLLSIAVFGSVDDGLSIRKQFKEHGFKGPTVFFNQYVTLHPETFLDAENSYVIMGEYEETLCEIIDAIKNESNIANVPYVWNGVGSKPSINLKRKTFLKPDRSFAQNLDQYLKTENNRIIGNVETARGCAHACNYCSVYAAYQRRVVRIPEEIVLADIKQCVRIGAGHITFIDADFFSTGSHGVNILRKMHQAHPWLTFDITCRVDDIVRKKDLLPELRALGCEEITSALEFPKQEVLDLLDKNITIEETKEAIHLLAEADIKIKPTFINFSPFISQEDLSLFDEFVTEMNLWDKIDPLQKETRLLLYKGSPLLKTEFVKGLELVEHETYFDWAHPDPAVDEAYEAIATPFSDGRRKKCCIKG